MIGTSIITHVTPVGRNIFADLGFDPEEAEALLAETDKGILSELPQPAVAVVESIAWSDAKQS
ncbi:hypothetical protein WAE56_14555 [Iodobacter sp. LRB]|uniref:hypothetical protein n=1 Tax=Iodobacter sp. LRB TaxID=3127955 RepID=UPI00307D441A